MKHQFRLHTSPIFFLLLSLAYTLAVGVALLLPVAWWLKCGVILLLLAALLYQLLRHALLLRPESIVAIRFAGGEVTLIARSGMALSGHIMRDSVVTPFLTILNVRPCAAQSRSRSVVIFQDGMDRERLRELRVLLKWSNNTLA